MVTFTDLRDAHVGPIGEAADAWEQLTGKSGTLEQRVIDELGRPLRDSGWKGNAASDAFDRLTAMHEDFELVAMQVRNVGAVLALAAAEFDTLQKNLHAAIDAAVMLDLSVNADGTVTPPELSWGNVDNPAAQDAHERAWQNAQIYTDLIRAIVAKATDADSRHTDALRGICFSGDQGYHPYAWNHANQAARNAASLLGLSADSIPPPGTDSKAAADWWAGLSPAQRDLMATAYPDRIGGLDGLPALDRDRANRLWLHDQIGDDNNNYRDPNDPHHQRLLNLLHKLDAAGYNPPAQQLYLLGLDNHGDGQAVVAVGNPDTARHTAVLVPGVSTRLDDMSGQIDRAAQIQVAADRLTPGANGDVAVVSWLGYDPPQMDESVVTAAGSHRAEAGAVSLDHFVDGLRASHDGSPDHITAIGHSYGSIVLGEAARNLSSQLRHVLDGGRGCW